MSKTSYANQYRNINFRSHPEQYVIGKGEQGVLIAEPYKSEILPHWRFKTPDIAKQSAKTIYKMFVQYGKQNDFVGMDMARKYLQMGFTRARRYANHASGKKYNVDGTVKKQESGSEESAKAASAKIFYAYYLKAKNHKKYQLLKMRHLKIQINLKLK